MHTTLKASGKEGNKSKYISNDNIFDWKLEWMEIDMSCPNANTSSRIKPTILSLSLLDNDQIIRGQCALGGI